MAIYGMKDASNVIMVDKATGKPALYIDYANATNAEFTSESVYATKKGTNSIRWDNARNGTMTMETELFDFGLLAMVMGADVKNGTSDIFKRVDAVVDESRKIKIGDGMGVDPSTISVLRLRDGVDDTEHVGAPLFNASFAAKNLPKQVSDVSVTYNDTTARISFPLVNGAAGYIIERDGTQIIDQVGAEYSDTGLKPETAYKYTVTAYNENGTGPESAVVEITTPAKGTEDMSTATATAQARIEAGSNVGTVAEADQSLVNYTYESGVVTLSQNAVPGDAYAIYYMEKTSNTRTLSIDANKFAGSYEIFADARIRRQDTGEDEFVQIHYFNARPQSNFTLTQSATEPTSLSIVFDLMPQGDKLAEFQVFK